MRYFLIFFIFQDEMPIKGGCVKIKQPNFPTEAGLLKDFSEKSGVTNAQITGITEVTESEWNAY